MFNKVIRITNPKLLSMVREMRCLVCQVYPSDAHHVTTKGAGGGDTGDNVMPLCRLHHDEWHFKGRETMVLRYKQIQDWLMDHERWDLLGDNIKSLSHEKIRRKHSKLP